MRPTKLLLLLAPLWLAPGLAAQKPAPCQETPAYRNHQQGLTDCHGKFTPLATSTSASATPQPGSQNSSISRWAQVPQPAADPNQTAVSNAQRDFAIWQLKFTQHVYQVQYWTTFVIFFFCMALVAAGLWFSWLQFSIAHRLSHSMAQQPAHAAAGHRPARLRQGLQSPPAQDPPQQEIEISKGGIVVRSSYLGVIILALSMVFLFLYLKFVYPINPT